MRDPHVVSLKYMLIPQENVTYKDTAVLKESREDFDLHLERDSLIVELRDHYSTIEAARETVDPFIRSWVLSAALDHGYKEFRFRYDSADVIDRNPSPPAKGKNIVELQGTAFSRAVVSASLSIARSTYSEPPRDFAASPNVETLWNRYEGYKRGNEPLPGMAYFCLTVIVGVYGGGDRTAAAKQLQVSRPILDMLGNFTARYGDNSEARKYDPNRAMNPLTGTQRKWLDAAVRLLIRRVGEFDADPSQDHPLLNMTNLPKL